MATDVVDIQIRDLTELFQSVKDDSKTDTAKKEEVLAEAKDLVQQLKVSVHSVADKTKKATVQGQIRGFEADVAKLQKSVLMAGASQNGAANNGDSGHMPSGSVSDAYSSQTNTVAILERSRSQLAETEGMATDIMKELDKQTHTIKRATDNMRETNSDLKKSDKLLNKMSKWWRG